MIVLDKSRALDLMLARAERIHVPPPFNAGFTADMPPLGADDPIVANPKPVLTNLLEALALRSAAASPNPALP